MDNAQDKYGGIKEPCTDLKSLSPWSSLQLFSSHTRCMVHNINLEWKTACMLWIRTFPDFQFVTFVCEMEEWVWTGADHVEQQGLNTMLGIKEPLVF